MLTIITFHLNSYIHTSMAINITTLDIQIKRMTTKYSVERHGLSVFKEGPGSCSSVDDSRFIIAELLGPALWLGVGVSMIMQNNLLKHKIINSNYHKGTWILPSRYNCWEIEWISLMFSWLVAVISILLSFAHLLVTNEKQHTVFWIELINDYQSYQLISVINFDTRLCIEGCFLLIINIKRGIFKFLQNY